MQITSISPLYEEKYEGCSLTSLNEVTLAEIGRIFAHYGLLVTRLREFVTFVASHCNKYPVSISTKDAVRLFPSVLDTVKPVFSASERCKLTRALENVATAREFIEHVIYCSWGSVSRNEDGTQQIARVEYRQYKNWGPRIDRREYSTADLTVVAMEISKAIGFISDIYVIFERIVAEKPPALMEILDRQFQ